IRGVRGRARVVCDSPCFTYAQQWADADRTPSIEKCVLNTSPT
ncbi:hypothetical protein DNTS_008932, partial [Danionella cerebrum]